MSVSARFEAVFHEGEYGESMCEWRVIEWTYTNPVNGAKSGRKVETFDYEDDALECAVRLNEQGN